MNIPDGEITLGTPTAIYLGFTPDKFAGYLWRQANRIIISLIISKYPGQGNLSSLFARILSLGYDVAVPTPSSRMRTIMEAKGFVQEWQWDDFYEDHVELWVSPSST